MREIRISGTDLAAEDGTRVGSLEVTVDDVAIDDRSFASIAGSLASVEISLGDGSPVSVTSVEISGPSAVVVAIASLDAAAASELIRAALSDAGVGLDDVRLVDDGVEVTLLGQRGETPLAVADGGLVIPSILGIGPIPIVVPGADDAWRIVAVRVQPGGLEVEATVDAGRLLARA